MDPLTIFSDIPAPAWIVLLGTLSGIAAWIVSARKINASFERVRTRMIAEASTGKAAERAAFRKAMMAEIAIMRGLVKECEARSEVRRP
jgi:hypothetical protein